MWAELKMVLQEVTGKAELKNALHLRHYRKRNFSRICVLFF